DMADDDAAVPCELRDLVVDDVGDRREEQAEVGAALIRRRLRAAILLGPRGRQSQRQQQRHGEEGARCHLFLKTLMLMVVGLLPPCSRPSMLMSTRSSSTAAPALGP